MIALLVLIALGGAVRAALPEMLRRALEARSGSLLRGELRIGDLDLSLGAGRVRLEQVEFLPEEGTGARPIRLPWLELAVAWWELPFGRVRVREIGLVGAELDIHRDPSGGLDLLELVPAAGPAAPGGGDPATRRPPDSEAIEAGTAAAGGAPEEGRFAWRVDRLEVQASRVRFTDEGRPRAPTVEVHLDRLELWNAIAEPGRPVTGSLRAELRVSGAPVEVEAELSEPTGDASAELRLEIAGLPLGLLGPYLERPDLRSAEGTLAADLSVEIGPGDRWRIAGELRAEDVVLRAGDGPTPALAVGELLLSDAVLTGSPARLRIGRLRVRHPRLPFDPAAPGELPLALALRGSETSSSPEDGPSFDWSVGRAELSGGELLLAPPDGETVSFDLELRDLASTDSAAALRAELAGIGGAAVFDGRLRTDTFGLAGSLALDEIALDRLGSLLGNEVAQWFREGALSGELELALGSLRDAPGSPEVAGTARVEDLVVGPSGGAVEARVGSVQAAGLGVRLGDGAGPARITVARLELGEPEIDFERRPPAGDSAGEETTAAPGAAAPAERSKARPPGERPGPAMEIGELRLRKGTVRFRDLTTSPFFRVSLENLEGDAEQVDLAAPGARRIELAGVGPSGSSLRVGGAAGQAGDRLEVEVTALDLRSLNPYAAARSVEIRGGILDLRSRVEIEGSAVRTRNRISIRRLEVGGPGADDLASALTGLPFSLAVALLEDPTGRIRLTVPLEVRERELRLGIGSVVRDAVRSALVGALASPLKLIGAVVPTRRGSVARPRPVHFVPGRPVIVAEEEVRLDELASFLASHPRLAVDVQVLSTDADRVARLDELLAEKLERPDLGLRLGTLGEGDALRALRQWLAQAPEDRDPSRLREDAAALRTRLHREIGLAPDWLDTLGARRLERLEAELFGEAGLEGRVTLRVEARPASAEPPRAELTVRAREP